MKFLGNKPNLLGITVLRGFFCTASIFLLLGPPTASAVAGWKDKAFFDSSSQKWLVEISSTVPKAMDCTISWNAIKIGSAANGGGKTVHGNYTLHVPAYQGSGTAVIVRGGISGVANFKHTTVCND